MSNKKVTDKYCQLCKNYDTCDREDGSKGCQEYEFYKCETCVDRILEDIEEVPRCFRGGTLCSQIEYCNHQRSIEKQETTQ